jgi:hypothetical protein
MEWNCSIGKIIPYPPDLRSGPAFRLAFFPLKPHSDTTHTSFPLPVFGMRLEARLAQRRKARADRQR